MEQSITKEDMKRLSFEDLPLYRLRKIGREVGVKAPTSLNKATLLGEISKILSGEKVPYNTTKGRPVREDFVITETNVLCVKEKVKRELDLLKKRIKKEEEIFLSKIEIIIKDFEENVKLKR